MLDRERRQMADYAMIDFTLLRYLSERRAFASLDRIIRWTEERCWTSRFSLNSAR